MLDDLIGDVMTNTMARTNMDELQRHAESIKSQEYIAANKILKDSENERELLSIDSLGPFAVEAYSRVADMFSWSDFETCKQFIMIGCGPLPVTLLHVADKCPDINILGIDIDNESIEMAKRVVRRLGLQTIELQHNDGISYVYSGASIIYVANLVFPKAEVLKQISRSAEPGSLVILRDPTKNGSHLADVGFDAIDESYSIEGMGIENEMFQSKHVFLRLTGK